MDYEKKYNEALERARKIHDEIVNNEVLGFPGQITDIFPELRESEDERNERIRKAIVHLLEVASEAYLIDATGFKKEQFLAYLEKQKPENVSASVMAPSCWEVEQKEQMMNEWLKDRDGCFWDGVAEGKKAMRDQMLKEIEDAKDFEKVLADVFQSATTLVSSPSELVDAFKGKLLRSAFKCFAEKKALRQSLFAKQFSELPDEIKAVIERIAHDSCYTFCESFASLVAADKSYRKGKHDMKEQMMKDAVEGEVVQDMQGVNRVKTFGEIPEWLHFGDKVRIIIVKEDER